MKGVTARQVDELGITLILNNTYHLSLRPGTEILDAIGGKPRYPFSTTLLICLSGSHRFQGWKRNLLTDSGGFQMVSLAKLSVVTEEGVL